MVKGKKRGERLTKEYILSRISDYDVYRYYFGDFKINHVIANHLRGDSNPSFIIGNKVGNELTHKDFGDYFWRGDCFDLVQQVYRCDFAASLARVASDFNISSSIEKPTIVTWEQPKRDKVTLVAPLFQVITRAPTLLELNYWQQYGIGYEQLKREDIFFPKSIYRNKQKIFMGDMLTFCYYYRELQVWKIYRPYGKKGEKSISRRKWDTGKVPFNYADRLQSIDNCEFSFITKSRKDRIVLQNCLETECITDVQAEDPSCISEETIIHMKENSTTQVTLFDNDKKGKESSWWLTNNHGFKHCNVPDKYMKEGITDFADMYKHVGADAVRNHFINKGFI